MRVCIRHPEAGLDQEARHTIPDKGCGEEVLVPAAGGGIAIHGIHFKEAAKEVVVLKFRIGDGFDADAEVEESVVDVASEVAVNSAAVKMYCSRPFL